MNFIPSMWGTTGLVFVLALISTSQGKHVPALKQPATVYTEWSEWTRCSVPCGGGSQKRMRTCISTTKFFISNYVLNFHRLKCDGEPEELRDCNDNPCQQWTDWAAWSEWSEWTPCSKSCARGTKRKFRQCVHKVNGHVDKSKCPGEAEIREECNTHDCQYWTSWSEWTECSVSCGGGSRSKVRSCKVPRDESKCVGESKATEECNGNPCLESLEEKRKCDGNSCSDWTDWTEWTECSATCGGGSRSKVRECKNLSDGCEGEDVKVEECNPESSNPCPMWTEWSEWSRCSTTCGEGKRQRGRECAMPTFRNGRYFCDGGPDYEEETCNLGNCKTWSSWFTWSTWGEWSECSKSCGGGLRTRYRTCPKGEGEKNEISHCGRGESKRREKCNKFACPSWTEWSEPKSWTEWSESPKSWTEWSESPKSWTEWSEPKSWTEWSEPKSWTEWSEPKSWTEWSEPKSWTEWSESPKSWTEWSESPKSWTEWSESPRSWTEWSEPKTWTEWSESPKSWSEWSESPKSWTEWSESPKSWTEWSESPKSWTEWSEPKSWTEWSEPKSWTEWSEPKSWTEWSEPKSWAEWSEPKSWTEWSESKSWTEWSPSSTQNEWSSWTQRSHWTQWSSWTPCSKHCGAGGIRMRKRNCTSVNQGDIPCKGNSVSKEECNERPCAAWSNWSSWNKCPASCGKSGIQKRYRNCKLTIDGSSLSRYEEEKYFREYCQGNPVQEKRCKGGNNPNCLNRV